MPRRKQSVPKKHGDEHDSSPKPPESSMESQISPNSQEEDPNKSDTPSSSPDTLDSSNGEVLDLSTKRRKISNTSTSSFGPSQPVEKKLTPLKVQSKFSSASSVIVMQPPFLGSLTSPKSMTSSPTAFSGVHPLLSPVGGLLRDRNCTSSSLPSTSSSPLPPKKRSHDLLTPLVSRGHPINSSGPGISSSGDALSSLTSLVSKVGATQSVIMASPVTLPSLYQSTGNPAGPSGSTPVPNETGGSSGVANAGGLNFQDLWLRFVKKEENAELKRMNEARKIFTCLQCETSFQSMDQLVKHMEATQHYTNIPKHYSWSLQMARQRMRHMKMKMKYSDKMMYFCFLCQNTFSEPVHVHFNCMHNMHNPAENMKFVHIISIGSDPTSKNSTSKNSSRKNTHANNSLSSSFSIPSISSHSNGTSRIHSHVTPKSSKKEAPGASSSTPVKTNDKLAPSGSTLDKMNDKLAAILTGFDDQSKLVPCNSLSKMEEFVAKKSTPMKLRSDKSMPNGSSTGSESRTSLPNGHSKSEG